MATNALQLGDVADIIVPKHDKYKQNF